MKMEASRGISSFFGVTRSALCAVGAAFLFSVTPGANASSTLSKSEAVQVASGTVSRAARQATVEHHTQQVMDYLKLTDPVKARQVRSIVFDHIWKLDAWHDEHNTQLNDLWNDFNRARSKKNEAAVNQVLNRIDAVYSSFQPDHESFNTELARFLTPAQIAQVKDRLTVRKVEVTFHAYKQIFPGLTDQQKAFILKNLKAAREQAIDAGSMHEKSAFFKKYKIRIEAYLTAQGYNVKECYRVFVKKLKAELAAKKAAEHAKQ